MKVLFVHQNFPGQFKNLAPKLCTQGHEVVALTMQSRDGTDWNGIRVVPYRAKRSSSKEIHPWVGDFETKIIRAEACFLAARQLREGGFTPDVIIAHPGWGESLFLKEVWPRARLGVYAEFFYRFDGADVGFDPEFSSLDPEQEAARIKLKNLNNLLHVDTIDAALSPTHWQASTFPTEFKKKISVIHDGIDTRRLVANPSVSLTLNGSVQLSRADEVVTFVNRNLEPYRGYHTFMRALPELLRRRPSARILIVGGDGVSYGTQPPNGHSWKNIFANEVRPFINDEQWARVHFLGNLPYDVFVALLQLSTVHVYLTYPFVLSWSLLEAMSVGCAIVGSRTSPVEEVISDGENGRLVDFFDHIELSSEIAQLLENAELRRVFGENARNLAVTRFDLETVCLPDQLRWVTALATG